jgi:hypothetical protein
MSGVSFFLLGGFVKRILSLALLLILLPTLGHAFDLFDPDRGKPPPPPVTPVAPSIPTATAVTPPPPPPPPPPPKPLLPQRDLLLHGVSQIGDKVNVILQTPDGKQFSQRIANRTQRTAVDLEGYRDYALLEVRARDVKMEYPENAPCRTPNKGVKCTTEDSGKTAVVSLELANPIAAPPPPQPQINPFMPQPTAPAPPNAPPQAGATPNANNPFLGPGRELTPEEVKQREEEFKKRQQVYSQFQRTVIKDADVPPGMRVVRTPFGDRLVPANQ